MIPRTIDRPMNAFCITIAAHNPTAIDPTVPKIV